MSDVKPSIFISYERTDSEFVERLDADLHARGFSTWVDRQELKGGQNWVVEIEKAIHEKQVVLVVLSPNAVASEWVLREIGYAQELRKLIIPLVRYKIKEIPVRLQDIQRIQFESSYPQGLDALLFSMTATPSLPTSIPKETPTLLTEPLKSTESELVEVKPNFPAPELDLDELWFKAGVAKSAGNLEFAEIYLKQIVLHQDDAVRGTTVEKQRDISDKAKKELEGISTTLHPIRIQLLLTQAQAATLQEEWRQSVGIWNALQAENPDNAIAAIVDEYLPIARQNARCDWLYEAARKSANEGYKEAAIDALTTLWSPGTAPYYGDPRHITTALGITVPPTYDEAKRLGIKLMNDISKARVTAEEIVEQAQRTREAAEQAARRIIEQAQQQSDAARKTADEIIEAAQKAANIVVEQAQRKLEEAQKTAEQQIKIAGESAKKIALQVQQKLEAADETEKKAKQELQTAREMQQRTTTRVIGSFAAILVFAVVSAILLKSIGLGLSLLVGWALLAVLAAFSGLVAALIVQQIARRLQPEVLRQRDQELLKREQQVAKTKRELEGRERSMADEKLKLQEHESQLAKAEQKQKELAETTASELRKFEIKVAEAEQAMKMQPKPTALPSPSKTSFTGLEEEDPFFENR